MVPYASTVAFSRKLKLAAVCTKHPNLPHWAAFADVAKLQPYKAVSPLRCMIHAEAKLIEYRKHEWWLSTAFLAEFQPVATPSRDGDPNITIPLQVWLISRTWKQVLQPHVHAPVKTKGDGAERIRHHSLRLLCPAQAKHFRCRHGDKGERALTAPCKSKVCCILLTFRAPTYIV